MPNRIIRRLNRNWRLTKNQVEWVKDLVDPRFDQDCEHCMYNLIQFLEALDV